MENRDSDLIGQTKEQVEWILNEEATKFRYDYIDDQSQIQDCTYDIDRITMTLRNGKVIATSRG